MTCHSHYTVTKNYVHFVVIDGTAVENEMETKFPSYLNDNGEIIREMGQG